MKKPSLLTFSVSLIIGHLSLSCAFPDGYLQALNVLLNKKRSVFSQIPVTFGIVSHYL